MAFWGGLDGQRAPDLAGHALPERDAQAGPHPHRERGLPGLRDGLHRVVHGLDEDEAEVIPGGRVRRDREGDAELALLARLELQLLLGDLDPGADGGGRHVLGGADEAAIGGAGRIGRVDPHAPGLGGAVADQDAVDAALAGLERVAEVGDRILAVGGDQGHAEVGALGPARAGEQDQKEGHPGERPSHGAQGVPEPGDQGPLEMVKVMVAV